MPSGVRVKGRVFDFFGGFKSQISVRGMSLDSKDMKSSICFANYYLSLGKSFPSLCLNFLICKIKIIKLVVFSSREGDWFYPLFHVNI